MEKELLGALFYEGPRVAEDARGSAGKQAKKGVMSAEEVLCRVLQGIARPLQVRCAFRVSAFVVPPTRPPASLPSSFRADACLDFHCLLCLLGVPGVVSRDGNRNAFNLPGCDLLFACFCCCCCCRCRYWRGRRRYVPRRGWAGSSRSSLADASTAERVIVVVVVVVVNEVPG